MPRVFSAKKNQKGEAVCSACHKQIERGETYYYFTRYRAGRRTVRCAGCYPKPSELTGSETLSTVYSVQEELTVALEAASECEEIISALDDAYSGIEDLISTLEEKISNLEDAFPNGCPALETLNEYLSAAETLRDEYDAAKDETESKWSEFTSEHGEEYADDPALTDEQNEEKREAWQAEADAVIDDCRSEASGIEWSL